ncbi:MAG: bifunctional diaminohydroxyphosphoribosylaminopyrimidine deaminase/5-amino-6-(5-phosphoribosylamino)uracil reductase RibD [Acidimicrobiales bacterium]
MPSSTTPPTPTAIDPALVAGMGAAIEAAATVRRWTSPNPWVGAALLDAAGTVIATGATEPPGGRHAEIVAFDAAGDMTEGATLCTTLEPCCHHGRTPPCTDRIIAAGVSTVVIGVLDPDPLVAGAGVAALEAAGIEVIVGVEAEAVDQQLAPYLHHRRTGRPWVVAKLASTLDGATAAADGTSQWITGPEARADGHRIRAESDAICVGAGTVRADDPSLTVRHTDGRDPRRVVLGAVPAGALVRPCLEWRPERDGTLGDLLEQLGDDGVLQLMVEGGAATLAAFHDADLVDEYVVYLAPALLGGAGGTPSLAGTPAASIDDLWRGRLGSVDRLGDDVRVVVHPRKDP